MSKSIKFKNNTYLDSRGIIHNKELLSDILGNGIETTTNANGTAIKFPDGTMIAYTDTIGTGAYNTSTHISEVIWNFPVVFKNSPFCLANARGGNSFGYMILIGVESSARARIQLKAQNAQNANAYVDSSNRGVNAIAIGRWK